MTLVCPACFGTPGLKRRIRELRRGLRKGRCDFHPSRKGVPIADVAKVVDEAFRYKYLIADTSHDGDNGDELGSIIYHLTGAFDADVVRAIVERLIEDEDCLPQEGDEPFYQDDFLYEDYEFQDSSHSMLWQRFRDSIIHHQRFFNERAKDHLKKIFDGVHLQRSTSRTGPVYLIEPGHRKSCFYRARIVENTDLREKIEADLAGLLGAPSERFRRAGRMNSAGISTFYAAFDFDTCIAELRPSVGSLVMGAEFEITEPLWVLDMTRFKAPPRRIDVFAHNRTKLAAQWQFMQSFMNEIAQPISPSDEHLDYIPTQAVAEYLLHHHEFIIDEKIRKIEAIIYSSAQSPAGKNIVILGEAAKTGTSEKYLTPKQIAENQEKRNDLLGAMLGVKFRISVKPATLETRNVTGVQYSSSATIEDYGQGHDEDF
jgi:hypothetical protein